MKETSQPNDAKQLEMLSEADERAANRAPRAFAIVHHEVDADADEYSRAVDALDRLTTIEYEKVRRENGFSFDLG